MVAARLPKFSAARRSARMVLIDEYQGDDQRSMRANNTSAFNCREIDGSPGTWSQHAYGNAVDINPLVNPWVRGDQVDPPEGRPYADRSKRVPGGIYAGDADRLSLNAGAPQLAAAARADASLIRALDAQRRASAVSPDAPVFFAPPDGMSRLTRELAAALGDRVRRAHPVERIERTAGSGWLVDGEPADAVVLTTPAPVTAVLLRGVAPSTAAAIEAIEYAGVVLVTFAYARDAIARDLDASGFLVPKTEGALLTACSWSSSKWAHLDRGSHVVLRASAGYFGNQKALALSDDELVQVMRAELGDMMGITAEPVEVRVSRWPQSFPQYTPGHLARVHAIESALAREAPGMVLAGAAYRGIGIPACITNAAAAARAVLAR